MADDQDILTVKEICELLRVHPSTVYKLLREGKIPGFRIGNEWRFRRDVIMRWMTQRSTETQQVRKVIDTGIDGGSRHRRRRSAPPVDLSARWPLANFVANSAGSRSARNRRHWQASLGYCLAA